MKIAFTASDAPVAQTARAVLATRYGAVDERAADVIVALGGDGFMLHTLHRTQSLDVPVYGMNRGTVGFLMNGYSESDLVARLKADLDFTSRTLRRKLNAEGSSYQQILSAVRYQLAREYLSTSSLPLEEISVLLGYSSPGNFTNAFKRWHGSSPRRFRQESR